MTPLWLHRGSIQRSSSLPACSQSGNVFPQSKILQTAMRELRLDLTPRCIRPKSYGAFARRGATSWPVILMQEQLPTAANGLNEPATAALRGLSQDPFHQMARLRTTHATVPTHCLHPSPLHRHELTRALYTRGGDSFPQCSVSNNTNAVSLKPWLPTGRGL